MQIISGYDVYSARLDASIITIGNFDGIHRGHAEIFTHLKEKSRQLGVPSVVVTFEPHPLKVLAPGSAPPRITTEDQKVALIEASGIDYLAVVPFTVEFSRLSPRDFVADLLCGTFGMRHIIIGHDYAFGRGREGNFRTLEELGREYGFSLEDLPPIGDAGVVFSSSLVRSALLEGDVETAARVLGRCYQISGTVVHGRAIGQALGYPTANIATVNELVPADGVYAVMVTLDGRPVQGACNIGTNPTVGGEHRTIEVFLLDFTGSIYDHEISLQFVQRLRSGRKFPDIDSLKAAIADDVARTRTILANESGSERHAG